MVFFNGTKEANPTNMLYCFYESLISGFQNAGNNVVYIAHNSWGADMDSPIADSVLRPLKEYDPDVIILFNNNFYDISKYFDCPIVIFEADSPLYFSNKNNIRKKPEKYKVLTTQKESINLINNELLIPKNNICLINPLTMVQAENIPQTTNISFIGTKFGSEDLTFVHKEFMKAMPNQNDIQLFKEIEKEIRKDPYIAKNELIKKFNITSSKILNDLITKLNISHFLHILATTDRVQILSQIADLGLDLYGSKSWITDFSNEPELVLSYKHRQVRTLKENQDVYNSSKLSININHTQAISGFSWRVCDIMASKACLVSEYKSGLSELFPDVPIPTFTNRYEAREQCLKLLNNENMRKDIVAQCQEAIDKKCRINNLLKSLEDFLEVDLGSSSIKKNSKELTTGLIK